MSFSFCFSATSKADALSKLESDPQAQAAPQSVRDFVRSAITPLSDNRGVSVRASGHLWNGKDYEVSTATIEVRPDQ